MAEVPPVDLGLLAGQRRQAQEGFGRLARPKPRDDGAEVVGAAIVARASFSSSESPGVVNTVPSSLDCVLAAFCANTAPMMKKTIVVASATPEAITRTPWSEPDSRLAKKKTTIMTRRLSGARTRWDRR